GPEPALPEPGRAGRPAPGPALAGPEREPDGPEPEPERLEREPIAPIAAAAWRLRAAPAGAQASAPLALASLRGPSREAPAARRARRTPNPLPLAFHLADRRAPS